MIKKKLIIFLLLICLIFITVFGYGCKKESPSNLPEETFSIAPLTVKTSKDLSEHQEEFIKIRDFKDDGFPILGGFRSYDNIALICGGFEKIPEGQPKNAVIGYYSMIIYDIKSDKILEVIKYDENEGFISVFPYGINENWIVYEEDDYDEFNPNFVFYAINRKTNETKKLIERKKGHDEFFTKGEIIPKDSGWRIASPKGLLKGDKFYMEIYLTGNKVEEEAGSLPVISDSIYEIDLKTGDIKRIVHKTERYGGIVSLSINDHYLAFCFAKQDFEKKMLVEDIYLYSFKSGKVLKFTDNGVSETPVLTPDDWIIYQVWLPSALTSDPAVQPQGGGGQFYNVIRPINKEKPVFTVTTGDKEKHYLYPSFRGISSSGRFILFLSPWRILDRKTNTITTLTGMTGFKSSFPTFRLTQFASDNTLLAIGSTNIPREQLSFELQLWQWLYIIDFNKLLQVIENK